MKKKILKIAIGIVAVPTVAFGTLYVAKEIPVVSKYVVQPMAQFSQSVGIPVIIMPSDNYFKQEATEVYEEAIRRYNSYTDKETMVITEMHVKNHNSDGVSVYQNYNAGVTYAELKIKPYEQFEKEWVEYSKDFYKNSKKPTQNDIDNYNNNTNKFNSELEKEQKLMELNQELQEAIQNRNTEKVTQLQQQIQELENQ